MTKSKSPIVSIVQTAKNTATTIIHEPDRPRIKVNVPPAIHTTSILRSSSDDNGCSLVSNAERDSLLLEYHKRVLRENQALRVARSVTLPLRQVQLFDVGCQTDVMALVQPGRMTEVNIVERKMDTMQAEGDDDVTSQARESSSRNPEPGTSYRRVYDEPLTYDVESANVSLVRKPLASLQKMFRRPDSVRKGVMLTQTPDGQLVLGGETLKATKVNGRIIASLADNPTTVYPSSPATVYPSSPATVYPSSPATGEPLDKIARLDINEDSSQSEERSSPASLGFDPTPMDVDDANTETADGMDSPVCISQGWPHKVTNLLTSKTPNLNAATLGDEENIWNTAESLDNLGNKNATLYGNTSSTNLNTTLNLNATNNANNRNVNDLLTNVNRLNIDRDTLAKAYEDWLNCIKKDSFSGNMPIHVAAMDGDCVALKRQCYLLVARNVSLDEKNYSSKTPLHLAILASRPDAVAILLRFGARLDVTDETGNNAIHLSIMSGRSDFLGRLLESVPASEQQPLDKFNSNGYTPLHLCCVLNKPYPGKLLLDRRAAPDLQDLHSGRTALFLAIEMDRVELVQLLLKAGAKPMIPNYAGQTPLLLMSDSWKGDPAIRKMFEATMARERLNELSRLRAQRKSNAQRRLAEKTSTTYQRGNQLFITNRHVSYNQATKPVRGPVDVNMSTQITESVVTDINNQTKEPVQCGIDNSQIVKPVQNPILSNPLSEPVRNLGVSNPPSEPVRNLISNPISKPKRNPSVSNPVSEPVRNPCVSNPISEPDRNPCVSNLISEPARNPCDSNPVSEPIRNLISNPVSEPVRNLGVSNPISEPLRNSSVSNPVSEPLRNLVVSNPVSEPVRNLVVSNPVSEPVRNLVVSNPVSNPVSEPIRNLVVSNPISGPIQTSPVNCNPISSPRKNLLVLNPKPGPVPILDVNKLRPLRPLRPFPTRPDIKLKTISNIDCWVPNVSMEAATFNSTSKATLNTTSKAMLNTTSTISPTVAESIAPQNLLAGTNRLLQLPSGYKIINLTMVRNPNPSSSQLAPSPITLLRKNDPSKLPNSFHLRPIKPMIFSTVPTLRKEDCLNPKTPAHGESISCVNTVMVPVEGNTETASKEESAVK